MHAIGHIAANISFAAVAISLTHTVKTLEPAFNVALARIILGEATPLPAVLSLIPIMVRLEPGWSPHGLVGLHGTVLAPAMWGGMHAMRVSSTHLLQSATAHPDYSGCPRQQLSAASA
jgi:hypothetical protein